MIPVVLLLVLGGLMHAAGSFTSAGTITLDWESIRLSLETGRQPTFANGSDTSSMELAFGFLLLAAFFGGRLVEFLKSPKLTGYILVGVIAGPFVLKLVTGQMTGDLKIVERVAVSLIALTAGAELSLKKMKPLMKTISAITRWAVLGTTVLIAASIFVLLEMQLLPLPGIETWSVGAKVAMCLMLAIVLASQSPAVVMALLEETHADGPVSQVSLAVVVIADLMVIVLYALFSSVAAAMVGSGVDIAETVLTITLEIVVSPLLGIVIGYIVAQYLRYVKSSSGLFLLLVSTVMAELSVALHLDGLMIMLTAGLYLENISKVDCHKLIEDLEGASLPVYLVFFALVGASLDLQAVYSMIIPASIIAGIRAIGFWKGSQIATRRAGADEQVQKWAWTGLLPQAGLALALVLHIGRTFPGDLGYTAAALILGVVGINQLITPILLRFALVKSGEAGKRKTHEFAEDTGEHEKLPAASQVSDK